MHHRSAGGKRVHGIGRGVPGDDHGPDMSRVLVVAASQINRIVIARTLERTYLKADAVAPLDALSALRERRPMMVIIDSAPDEDWMEALLSDLARRRRASERQLPCTILIAERERETHPAVDAVVARPITPDTLQPVVERIAAPHRPA